MKRTILMAALLFSLSLSTASAMVGNGTDKGTNYEMTYPLVYVDDKQAQDRINQDIYHYIAFFRDNFQAGNFMKGKFWYDVRYEDRDFVSLCVWSSQYNMGAAHAQYACQGLVYDKHTGSRLPLENFLRIGLQDIKAHYSGHVYDEKGKLIRSAYGFPKQPRRISEDYFLLGNGAIALIYQPYELASFASGATTIRFDRSEVEYFNRKNR